METSLFILTLVAVLTLLHIYRYEMRRTYEKIQAFVKELYHRMQIRGSGKLTFAA